MFKRYNFSNNLYLYTLPKNLLRRHEFFGMSIDLVEQDPTLCFILFDWKALEFFNLTNSNRRKKVQFFVRYSLCILKERT